MSNLLINSCTYDFTSCVEGKTILGISYLPEKFSFDFIVSLVVKQTGTKSFKFFKREARISYL